MMYGYSKGFMMNVMYLPGGRERTQLGQLIGQGLGHVENFIYKALFTKWVCPKVLHEGFSGDIIYPQLVATQQLTVFQILFPQMYSIDKKILCCF